MAEALTPTIWQKVVQRLEQLPMPARRLLCVIVHQAYHGTLRTKTPGRATMPEIHEACGLDVDELQGLLTILKDARIISLEGFYPFEEVLLDGQSDGDKSIWETVMTRCDSTGIALESVIMSTQPERLFET